MEVKNYSSNYLCKYCGSEDITETEYGYVCRKCATDQGRKRYQSTTSYNGIQIQNAITLRTTMGTERERERSTNRGKITYLNKLNSMISHPKETRETAFNQTKTSLKSWDGQIRIYRKFLKNLTRFTLILKNIGNFGILRS